MNEVNSMALWGQIAKKSFIEYFLKHFLNYAICLFYRFRASEWASPTSFGVIGGGKVMDRHRFGAQIWRKDEWLEDSIKLLWSFWYACGAPMPCRAGSSNDLLDSLLHVVSNLTPSLGEFPLRIICSKVRWARSLWTDLFFWNYISPS